MDTDEVQNNVTELPNPPSKPEDLLLGPFSTFAEFEKNLNDYEKATYRYARVFRKNDTLPVHNAGKYLNHTMPDDVVYQRVQFVCQHFGLPRRREGGSTSSSCGCEAEIVLEWDDQIQKLVVSKKNLNHSHELNAFTYNTPQFRPMMDRKEKETLKMLIERNNYPKGLRLPHLGERLSKKFVKLRHRRRDFLIDQLREHLTPEEAEYYANIDKLPSKNKTLQASSDGPQDNPTEGSAVADSDREKTLNEKSPQPPTQISNSKTSVAPPIFQDPMNKTDLSRVVARYLKSSNSQGKGSKARGNKPVTMPDAVRSTQKRRVDGTEKEPDSSGFSMEAIAVPKGENLEADQGNNTKEKDSNIIEKDSNTKEKDSNIIEKDSNTKEKDSNIIENDSNIIEKIAILYIE